MATSVGPIVRVVAGESHTLVLTDDGKVFSWGKGFFGRLGNGSSSDQWVPAEIQFTAPPTHTQHALNSDGTQYPHRKITSIAAGAYHSLALTDKGEVWSWGYNLYGQLGHEDFDDALPHPICSGDLCEDAKSLSTVAAPEGEHVEGGQEGDKMWRGSKVVMVEAGGMMSCAIDQSGVLWMWGHCPFPTNECTEQLFMLSVCQTPRPVAGLKGLYVTKVACGNDHVIALADSQYDSRQSAGKLVCYAWGSNTYGQLGLGDRESRVNPQRVQALDEQKLGTLSDVACGAYHSAILAHNEERGELERSSMCLTFGMGENGQLGHGNTQSLAVPQMVESLPENERIVAVACGLFHMGVVTEAGGVWIWGMERGLGLCPGIGSPGTAGGDYMLPVRVTGSALFTASNNARLACGAAHTVLAANDGEQGLSAWGRGQNGVLGTGQCVDSLTPCPVIWPPHNVTETTTAESHAEPSVFENNTSDNPLKHSPSAESGTASLEQMLAIAQREICALMTELAGTKRQHALLHAALYGPSESSNVSDSWETLREWDKAVVESSYDELVRLDDFYRQARSRVKEVLLQKRVEDYCKHLMGTSKSQVKDFTD